MQASTSGSSKQIASPVSKDLSRLQEILASRRRQTQGRMTAIQQRDSEEQARIAAREAALRDLNAKFTQLSEDSEPPNNSMLMWCLLFISKVID